MSARRAMLRLASRDARRHRMRTLLATLIVALPAAAAIVAVAFTQTVVPAREAALASLHPGVQARIVATAVNPLQGTLRQAPEGLMVWMDDPGQPPATAATIQSRLSQRNRLLPYWESQSLLAVTGLDEQVGKISAAGANTDALDERRSQIVPTRLTEGDAETLSLRMKLTSGAAPRDASDLVVSQSLAKRLNLSAGSKLTLVAAPWNGWMSSGGRIGQAVADQQKTFRVSGIAAGSEDLAWALSGWVSKLVDANPAGIDARYLVVGPDPVTWGQVKELNQDQVVTVSRHALENYPPAAQLYPQSIDARTLLGQIAATALTMGLSGALLLGLVTPAFTVAVEQQRRLMGLASAIGASPRDLKRMISAQGLLVGGLGSLVGILAGVSVSALALPWLRPEVSFARHFPWWVLPVAAVLPLVMGWFATILPARRAAGQSPLDAIKERFLPVKPRASRWFLGPALLFLAAVVGAVSLLLPLPEFDQASHDTSAPLHGLLLALALLAALAGSVFSLGPLLSLLNRWSRGWPLAVRTAIRDAHTHRSRVIPAAVAVAVSMLAASFVLVMMGSMESADRDRQMSMGDYGRPVLGLHVPVSDGLDRRVVLDAVALLKTKYPVTATHPIWAVSGEGGTRLGVQPSRPCPDWHEPDYRAALEPGARLRCVPYLRGYVPGLSVPWWVGNSDYVMTGSALLAGHPDATEAAKVLDSGGVLVRNTTWIENSQVVVETQQVGEGGKVTVTGRHTFAGAFYGQLGAPLVLSPQAAAEMGLELRYAGEIVETSRPLSGFEANEARALLQANSPLVWPNVQVSNIGWAAPPVMGLAVVAVLAAAIATSLARTQSLRELSTMHAIGAEPGFLRRYLISQAALILGLGVPLGWGLGLVVGGYAVAWNRELSGGWRVTTFLWGWQSVLIAAVVAVGLITGAVLSRPPKHLTKRLAD